MTDVAGKNVLITGGAKGIGRLMGLELAKKKANIVIWDIDHRATSDTVEEIGRVSGRKAHGFTCDISNRTEVYEVATRVEAEVGPVDILINNAGVVSGQRLLEIPDHKIEQSFKVNAMALFWTAKAFLPRMVARNAGHIVTISSAGGLIGSPKMSDYSASKFAAVGFDESLRAEMRQTAPGVKTTLICPYYINTGMFRGVKTRFSFLLPILDEDYVSRRVVGAIEKEKLRLFMPRFVYVTPTARGLLPARLFDMVAEFMGINACMEDFTGREAGAGTAPHLKEVVNERQ